jgi:hypothetical protein
MNEWLRSIGGILLTRETDVLGEKSVPVTLSPQHTHMQKPGLESRLPKRETGIYKPRNRIFGRKRYKVVGGSRKITGGP